MPLRYPLEKTMQANKTIQVVDSVGNRYEATYLKRAKGLVKHGRARFIDEHTICLACPPNNTENSEDNEMTNTNIENTILENTNTAPVEEITSAPESKYTLEYALEQIEKIANDKDAILGAFNTLSCMENAAVCSDSKIDAMAEAVSDTVKCRETTNQKLIEFYSKMVDDLKPQTQKDERGQFLEWVTECVRNMKPAVSAPDFEKLWKAFHPEAHTEQDKWNAIAKLADAAMLSDDYVESRSDMISEIRQILRENK